jgi:hypothetical protein
MKIVIWGLLFVVSIVLLLSLTGAKRVKTEVTIAATPSEIWSVLVNTAQYKDWNPVIVSVEGSYTLNSIIKNKVKMPPDGKLTSMSTKVKGLKKNEELFQFGGTRGLMTFAHRWILIPVKGGTRVIQQEEYRGLIVWFWKASMMEAVYSRANEALKKRVLLLKKKTK